MFQKTVIYATAIAFLSIISFKSLASETTDFIPEKSEKNGYVEPFQMFDNVFYVGDKWVSSYLIRTSEGFVLVDALESPYGRWIPENIKKLGLDPAKIKYILVTHGHSDHVGGVEYIQAQYGSQVIMSQQAFDLTQKQSQKSKDKGRFEVPEVKHLAKGGDTFKVGQTEFKFHSTPGHTQGALSIDFFVTDKGKEYRAFIVGGNGTNFDGLDLAQKYVISVEKIKAISQEPPAVEVNLASHPRLNQLFERKEQIAKGRKNPFIDAAGFQAFLNVLEARGAKKLLEEQAK